jgi:hypothetical protein
MTDKDNFLYPRYRYRGTFTPQNLAFDANLQEFAQRVGYIVSLETSGKLTETAAFDQIKALWKQVKASKKGLDIGKDDMQTD